MKLKKEKTNSYLTTSSSKSKNLSHNLNIIKSNIIINSKESSPDLGNDYNYKHGKNNQNTYNSKNRLIPIKNNKILNSKFETINLKSKNNNNLYEKDLTINSINNYKRVDSSSRRSVHSQNLGDSSSYSIFSKRIIKKITKIYEDEVGLNTNEKMPLDNTKYKENKMYINDNNKKSNNNISADRKNKVINLKENQIIDLSIKDNKKENDINSKNKENNENILIINKKIKEKSEKSKINLLRNKKEFNYNKEKEK